MPPTSAAEEQGIGTEWRLDVAADETGEGDDHDERSGRRLAQREAVDHLCGCEPPVMLDRTLIHVRQRRIGAADGGGEARIEGEDRHEGRGGDGPHEIVLEHARAYAVRTARAGPSAPH